LLGDKENGYDFVLVSIMAVYVMGTGAFCSTVQVLQERKE